MSLVLIIISLGWRMYVPLCWILKMTSRYGAKSYMSEMWIMMLK
ncbi:Uncharacterised protein [Paraprevotella clara]|uniref:Uncharacterized protein n=1 Tax=Paraprevotella clara TaxID=454154 RepID=A0A6N3G6I8_9BACT